MGRYVLHLETFPGWGGYVLHLKVSRFGGYVLLLGNVRIVGNVLLFVLFPLTSTHRYPRLLLVTILHHQSLLVVVITMVN